MLRLIAVCHFHLHAAFYLMDHSDILLSQDDADDTCKSLVFFLGRPCKIPKPQLSPQKIVYGDCFQLGESNQGTIWLHFLEFLGPKNSLDKEIFQFWGVPFVFMESMFYQGTINHLKSRRSHQILVMEKHFMLENPFYQGGGTQHSGLFAFMATPRKSL